MNKTIRPLVLTPKHHPTESLLGYTLRVSEKNGYDTPWHIMAYAGLPPGKMDSAGFPIDKLAAILARDVKELEPISYGRISDDGNWEFRLLGQSFGRSLQFSPMRLNRPQFCQQCAQEKGFLDAFWDLSLAVACPEHHCSLVDSCTECGEKLTWFRPGILTCKCGANLADSCTNKVSDELASMMAVIQAKVHGKPVNAIVNSCGFPFIELENMSLRSLLVMMDTLGRHNLHSHDQSDMSTMSIVQSAIEVLHNWPNGYYDFLRRVGKRNVKAHVAVIGLRKQFESLYITLFKRRRSLDGLDFLRDEFVRFGLEEWGEGVIDNKLLRGEQVYKRFVSNSEQAARMGVRPITLRRWGKQGIVKNIPVSIGKQTRYIIDSNAISLKRAEGKSFGDRDAAAYIGLPVSVLKLLRYSGHYEVRHVTNRLKSFHEIDLNSFINSLCSLGEAVAEVPSGAVSLKEVMHLIFRNKEGKPDFVRELLAKKIEVVGRIGASPAGLLFNKERAYQFLRDKRAESENGTWSLSETAKYLHCDPSVLPMIAKKGLLEVAEVSTGKRVTEKSIKDFDAKFVSVAKLAKKTGTSSRRLKEKIINRGIPITTFERGYDKVDQPFVSREWNEILNEILGDLK